MTKTPLHTALALVPPGAPRRGAFGLLLMLLIAGWPQAAEAQLDPLLLLKRSIPNITTPLYRANVLVAIDVAPRMQYDADGNYYDPTDYVRGNAWDAPLGVSGCQHYRTVPPRLQEPCMECHSAPEVQHHGHLDCWRCGDHAVHRTSTRRHGSAWPRPPSTR